MSKIQLNVKLNRAIYSEEEFEEMQRLMSAYALVTSKRSGKIFLVLSKYSKASLHWSDIAFSLLWFALIMPIPISKWICFPLATVATVIMIAGLSALRKRYRKKCQSHPLMVLDPQKKTIAFYRFKKDLRYLWTSLSSIITAAMIPAMGITHKTYSKLTISIKIKTP